MTPEKYIFGKRKGRNGNGNGFENSTVKPPRFPETNGNIIRTYRKWHPQRVRKGKR